MRLAELEEQARQKLEEVALKGAEGKAQKLATEQAATETFRQKVIVWMVKEGMDAKELVNSLRVTDREQGRLELQVPEHTTIAFSLIKKGNVFAVRDDRFDVDRGTGSYSRRCSGLGDALVIASEEYQKGEEQDIQNEAWEIERQANREQREREALERGQNYLALLDDYPVLRPILNILALYLNQQEQFAEELYRAEEFAANVEAGVDERLRQAQYETHRATQECDGLRNDLHSMQDKLREAERKCKHSGW